RTPRRATVRHGALRQNADWTRDIDGTGDLLWVMLEILAELGADPEQPDVMPVHNIVQPPARRRCMPGRDDPTR
ncbi:MAG: hypothetical protein ACRDZU_05200, partial [Acidimicrobiales bacterium]